MKGIAHILFPGAEDPVDKKRPVKKPETKKEGTTVKPDDWKKMRGGRKPAANAEKEPETKNDANSEGLEPEEIIVEESDVDSAEDAKEKKGKKPPVRRTRGSVPGLVEEDFLFRNDEEEDDDEDEDDDADDDAEYLEEDPHAEDWDRLADWCVCLKGMFEDQERELTHLNQAIAKLTDLVTDLVAKLALAQPTPATVDIEPLKKLIGAIPAETAKALPAAKSVDLTPVLSAIKTVPSETVKVLPAQPDFGQVLTAIEEIPAMLSKYAAAPAPASAQAPTLEDSIDADIAIQEWWQEIEGFEFRKGYDLNGAYKTPEEVATFFGNADPASHGLKLRVAKFEKGKFVAWSDERHLRAHKIASSEKSAPAPAPKAPAKKEKATATATPKPAATPKDAPNVTSND